MMLRDLLLKWQNMILFFSAQSDYYLCLRSVNLLCRLVEPNYSGHSVEFLSNFPCLASAPQSVWANGCLFDGASSPEMYMHRLHFILQIRIPVIPKTDPAPARSPKQNRRTSRIIFCQMMQFWYSAR